ncbi:holo-ACP synthase [Corynebacterium breve]|uniref:Holo-ACP synthase n=1 Tax=Corynebacterium breve TaxID=3049799 RepID=A0ABY8VCM3_9CORY|nr:holo-ACP synthase [Corynebacterium breve]WIM67243.1 holo-ACP synthase [Corynebacterium breve]
MHIGVDLVCISDFRTQLEVPGSTFEQVFTSRELRVAGGKPDRAEHLAGRWAAKEAFIKAWSQSLYGLPPVIEPDRVDFAEIEVVADRFGRVAVQLHGAVAAVAPVAQSLSISHDGDYAMATCLVM